MTGPGRPIDQERAVAQVLGDRFYEGAACQVHGTTTRYTSSGICLLCAASTNEKSRDKVNPNRPRRSGPRLLSVAEHLAACQALDNFGEAVADVDHDLLEASKDPWE